MKTRRRPLADRAESSPPAPAQCSSRGSRESCRSSAKSAPRGLRSSGYRTAPRGYDDPLRRPSPCDNLIATPRIDVLAASYKNRAISSFLFHESMRSTSIQGRRFGIVMAEIEPTSQPQTDDTTCCIVGGGPAGVVLGFLLARAGVDVLVLEKHKDF